MKIVGKIILFTLLCSVITGCSNTTPIVDEAVAEEITSEKSEHQVVPDPIVVSDIKSEFSMEELISKDVIDLTCEPELDTTTIDSSISKDDLNITVYNRKLTITGTPLDTFLETFDNSKWVDVVRENHRGMLHPYTTMRYNITLSDSLENTLIILIANMTAEERRVGECPIYGIKVKHPNGIESIKSGVSAKENIRGNRKGYLFNIFNSSENDFSICEISPLYESVEEYISTLESTVTPLENKDYYEFGSNIIYVAGKVVDFNEWIFVDYLKNFECSKGLEIPGFSINVNLHDEVVYDDDKPFKIYGIASCVIELDRYNSIFVNAGSYRVPSETNLYLSPVKTIFTDITNNEILEEEVFNFGGLTNFTKGEEVQTWFESIPSNCRYMVNSRKENIYPIDNVESIYTDGIKDDLFLNFEGGSNFSYSYLIRSNNDYFNVNFVKTNIGVK